MVTQMVKDLLRDQYYTFISWTASSVQTVSLDGTIAQFKCRDPEEYKDFYKFEKNHSEKHLISNVIDTIQPGDCFHDIGAKVGLYSVLVGHAHSDIQLVLFEPHPRNAERCLTNLELNNLSGTIREEAVTNFVGDSTLFTESDAAGTGTHSVVERSGRSVGVDAVTLDDYTATGAVPNPDVMKIDVEGAEDRVLEGMESLLNDHVPRAIFIEVHTSKLSKSLDQGVQAPLLDAGYETEILSERGTGIHIKATIP